VSAENPRFLPEYLRPQTPGRRSRRGLVLLSVVPFMLLAVPMWRVETVQIDACPKLPQSAVASLQELVGQPALGLDVGAIKERIQIWPGVGEVGVDFVLPGTVVVRAETAPTLGSVRVGTSWHGVGADGSLTGRLQRAADPVLEGFAAASDRRFGLAAALRIEKAARIRVATVRRITPGDYRVQLAAVDGQAAVVLHIRPRGSAAEQAWCAQYASGNIAQKWADLRWSDRIVIGGGV
jgi:hypothetical protein